MSLFDPSTVHDEARLFNYGPDGSASGEAIPELPEACEEELRRRLLNAGLKIARSPSHDDGWEDAYSAFAEALQQAGCVLTEPILSLDIPNMLFNFALVNSWFPHLTSMLSDYEVPELTFPARLDSSMFSNKSRDPGYRYEKTKEESLKEFRRVIRPAVMEWNGREVERRKKLRADILEAAGREAPEIDIRSTNDPEVIAKHRAQLLADFRQRVKDENGKEIKNYALYNARQHSMYKSEFFKWMKGKLSADSQTVVSFERFLKGNQRPIPRGKTSKP